MPGNSVAKIIYHLHLHRSDEGDAPHWTNHLTLSRNPEGQPLLRPSYQEFMCPECHTLDKDALFDQGFDEGPMIWMKGGQEMERTPDGFLCIHARVLTLLQEHSVGGFESQPIPLTSWYVVRITEKVASAQKRSDFTCKVCGAVTGHGGWDSLEEIELPDAETTFFTTQLETQHGLDYSIWHRAQVVFVTDKLAQLLKAGRVIAGMLLPILSTQELQSLKETMEKGGTPRLKHPIIRLM
jgi:hypothetical protein